MQSVLALAALALLLPGCAVEAPEAAAPAPGGVDPPITPPVPGNATWGEPDGKPLRPGINMVHDGAGCTTSFLFQHQARIFMATAAHCVAGGDGCDEDRELPDEKATLRLTDGTEARATVAYHSWTTMSRVAEDDPDACDGNDFALLELAPEDVARAHPASLHFRAPTGLGTEPTDDVWGFGASSLRQGVQEVHPKKGRHLGVESGGWLHHVYLATPGIPGDSGGHIMTDDGKALGIAHTVTIAPTTGSNHYTDVAKSLAYMLEHEGWAPTIVTWDDFNPSLV